MVHSLLTENLLLHALVTFQCLEILFAFVLVLTMYNVCALDSTDKMTSLKLFLLATLLKQF